MDMKRIEFSNGYESIWEKYFAFIIFLSLNFLYRRLSRYVYFWTLVDNQLYKPAVKTLLDGLWQVGYNQIKYV